MRCYRLEYLLRFIVYSKSSHTRSENYRSWMEFEEMTWIGLPRKISHYQTAGNLLYSINRFPWDIIFDRECRRIADTLGSLLPPPTTFPRGDRVPEMTKL